jgi:hypothetical protein
MVASASKKRQEDYGQCPHSSRPNTNRMNDASLLRSAARGYGLSTWGCLFLTDKLFGSTAIRAAEGYEVGLRFSGLVRGQRHYGAAVETRRVFTGIQRIQQKVLVAHDGKLRSLAHLATAEKADSCDKVTGLGRPGMGMSRRLTGHRKRGL